MNQQELSHTLRKEIIRQGRSVQIFASGYSMFPFLRKGDLLTVEPVPMETIKRGDIVVFEIGEKWIAHRVIRVSRVKNRIELSLRGDSCVAYDPVVNEENYIGAVIKFQRRNSIRNLDSTKLNFWKKNITGFGLLYNLPIYCARIFVGFILSPFLKRNVIQQS